jgi:CheY-like chemotaxis protein
MKESILKNKMILAVDEEPDFLTVMEEEILDACPDCKFNKATTFEEAVKKIASSNYDMVILDILAVQGYRLAQLAIRRRLPVTVLAVHPLSPEVLEYSFRLKPQAYFPKEKVSEIVPFLEGVLEYQSSHASC